MVVHHRRYDDHADNMVTKTVSTNPFLGSITVAIGLIIMVILPDFPHNWNALSPEMKHVANRRMAVEAAEVDVDEPGLKTQLKGFRLAFADPKTYMLAIAYMAITGAAGM